MITDTNTDARADIDTDTNAIPAQNQRQVFPLEFRGSGTEYFQIWIINTLLTIITLGIYSPWAKVRKLKYFYRSTYLNGDAFDFHADPVKILIGRLIILTGFIALNISQVLSPILWGILLILGMIAFPWIIVRSAIFRYRNSSYRNIRFGFNKNYPDAYFNYITAGLVSMITLSLGFPFAIYKHYNFILNNIRYGQEELSNNSRILSFFKIFYSSLLLGFAIIFVPIVILSVIIGVTKDNISWLTAFSIFFIIILTYGAMALTYAFQRAMLVNEITNNSGFNTIKFRSRLKVFGFGFIMLTNLIMIVCTLGFATPWAQVRALRYRLHNTFVIASPEDFNRFLNSQDNPEGYVADAATDFWDIDFGI